MSKPTATRALRGRPRSATSGNAVPRPVTGCLVTAATLGSALLLGLVVAAPPASAAQPTVGLGTAAPFAVLAGTTVTNTGPSVISGDVGVDPGSAVTGFPPGSVINGTQHVADAVALQAQSDVTTAYNDAAGRTPVVTESSDLGGAQPCNVFWQVGSSATLGSTTTFVGTILALTSASLQTGATVQGRVLARNGQVSLDDNTITQSSCATASSSTTTTTSTAAAGATTTTTGGNGTSVAGVSTGTSGSSQSATGVGASTATGSAGSSSTVVPLGSPATGFGGAARATGSPPLAIAGAALLASGGLAALVTRRHRVRKGPVGSGIDSPGG